VEHENNEIDDYFAAVKERAIAGEMRNDHVLVKFQVDNHSFLKAVTAQKNPDNVILIEPVEVDSRDAGFLGDAGLLGKKKGDYFYLSTSNHVLIVTFVPNDIGIRLEKLGFSTVAYSMTDDIDDESDYEEDEGDFIQLDDNQINYLSIKISKNEQFASLKTKKDKEAFVRSLIDDGEFYTDNHYDVISLAEKSTLLYDNIIFPELCRSLKEDGLTEAEIAKKTGKTKAKVEKSINTIAPDFVRKIFDATYPDALDNNINIEEAFTQEQVDLLKALGLTDAQIAAASKVK
jgi:hypothetical protein